jgi:hypothetical protein
VSVSIAIDCRYHVDRRDFVFLFDCATFSFSLISLEIETVHISGPVDLRYNDRLRKENRMGSSEESMFDGS